MRIPTVRTIFNFYASERMRLAGARTGTGEGAYAPRP